MLNQSAYLNSATEAYSALLKPDLNKFDENSSVPKDVRTKMLKMLFDFSQGANQPSKVSNENRKIEALFLGPRAENFDTLKSMLLNGLEAHKQSRLEYLITDPTHITGPMKISKSYLDSQDEMQSRLVNLLMILKKYTVPFYSPRYAGHMNWDVTLPGIAGYFSAMLYNPNNVAFEGSPVTTILELLCAQDLCRLFDFPEFEPYLPDSLTEAGIVLSWGHLTCDGTMANIEALWSSRNAKYYPLAIKRAISEEEDLRMISHKIKVKTAQMVPPVIVTNKEKEKPGDFRNKEKSFVDCSLWELMNIPLDQILNLTPQIYKLLREAFSHNEGKYKDISDVYTMILQYSIQKKGLLDTYAEMRKMFPSEMPSSYSLAQILVSGSKHYSLPKAVSLIGLGEGDLINVALTEDARLDIKDLKKKLKQCFKHQIPVITVILVMGSTEEGSVDPLYDVLCLRDKYRQKHGLDFNIHADCAYGGYFKSLTKVPIPEVPDRHSFLSTTGPSTEKENVKELPKLSGLRAGLNKHTQKQFNEALKHVDTLTVDPHKTGYIPYACGAFLYRNGLMKNMLLFTGPYLGSRGPNLSTFGVEGSKAGAQAAAVYLTHQCIPLDINGYGSLLGLTLFNAKLYYIKLLSFESRKQKDNFKFRVTPLPRLPSERNTKDPESDYDRIDRLSKMTNAEIAEQISQNGKLREFFYEVGPDLNILAYNFNFYDPTLKKWNSSLNQMNKFTHELYKRMSPNIAEPRPDTPHIPVGDMRDLQIFVSETEISPLNYGEKVFSSFIARTRCSRGSQQVSTETEKIVCDADRVVLLRSVLMDPWTSETESGDFFEIILEQLDRICCEVMEERLKKPREEMHSGCTDF